MSESTITTKGQTTVPADVRERLGSTPGTKLVWNPMPDGRVLVRDVNGNRYVIPDPAVFDSHSRAELARLQ